MPDHEEAVREAYRACQHEADIRYPTQMTAKLREYERAIRASERAKYAALVAASERALGYCSEAVEAQTDEGTVTAIGKAGVALARALAALQSKEGTNE